MSVPVVVTGLGVCASNGVGVPAFLASLRAGRSGIGPITSFDASALRSRIAGEVLDLHATERLPSKTVRRTARFAQLAIIAAEEALAHAGIPLGENRDDIAVVIGTGAGGFDVIEREHQAFLTKGPTHFSPFTVPMVIPNMAAAGVALETGCRGPNLCVTTACAAGAHSIGTALDLLRLGRAEVAIAGSTESTISAFAIDGYCQLRALSLRNDAPERASRPFSADRDGFVIAEGAGVVVLETLAHARARGARPLAVVAGYGASAAAHHITAPDPEGRGAVRAMRAALADAALAPADVQVVNAHGTSTTLNDAAETLAIHQVFGEHARRLLVHATKSMTGHALGGSGGIEAVASVLTLLEQWVHPTINLEVPDPECDLDFVPRAGRDADVRTVMSNSFGFGGHNGVLVLRRYEGETA
jgi:3-oxoacyl-[acyl-carrier-protein] synthase II